MVKNYVVVIVVVIAAALLLRVDPADGKEEESRFLNEWAVEIEGGLNHARSVAERHGFELLGQMPFIDNHFIVRHVDVPIRSKRSADHHTTRLTEDSQVKWAEQQFVRARSKRGHAEVASQLLSLLSPEEEKCDENRPLPYNDPDFPCQWYMVGDDKHEYMSNVMNVWAQGITGKGVVVCVVDDGLEHNHTDLVLNYDPHASWDLNSNDSDPMPHYNEKETNKHGTRCAGEIAMVANNRKCGVGIAFNSKIGGIRLLDGNVTDRLEADALSFNHTYIDVYSMSWGPTDDGKTLDKPHRLAQKAMETAINKGRGGKGVIYTLASGNGGGANDDCNCDGYASSLYTISVSSVSRDGNRTFYGECCASSLTTTYSSGGAAGGPSVVSTDLHDGCTHEHSGTSASAPMASGFIALALEVNPDLTWRDVQHLVVITSRHDQLMKTGWYKNAADFWVNPAFGFGVMDPEQMVEWAKIWKPVPKQRVCHSTPVVRKMLRTNHWSRDVKGGGEVKVTFDVDSDCCRKADTVIKYLEHVQFIFTMNYTTRGAVSAYATSPCGTNTVLLSPRTHDNSTENFEDWPLMSVHTWGENPCGKWTFRVADEGKVGKNNSGALVDVKMILYGTETAPFYRKHPSPYCRLPKPSTTQKVQTGLKISGSRPHGGKNKSKYLWFRDTDETNRSSE